MLHELLRHSVLRRHLAGRSVTGCALVALVVAAMSGCASRRGPASESLLTCRELSEQGLSAIEQGNWSAAESYLAKATQACPVDAESRRYYADVLWRKGSRVDALKQLEEAIRLSSDDPVLLVRAAEMRLALGETDAARQLVEQSIDIAPHSASAWGMRGRVMQHSGDVRQALADYHRSLSYDPRQMEILVQVASLYLASNEPRRAMATLQAAADLHPPGEEPQAVLHLLGVASTRLNRYDDATRQLAAAAQRGPASADIFCALGEAELLAGRSPQAIAAARQALAIQPDYMPAKALLDRIELARHQAPAVPRR